MSLIISFLTLWATLASSSPRLGLDRDPVCVAEALLQGNPLVLLPGEPASPPCAWGPEALVQEIGRATSSFSWWNTGRTTNLTLAAKAVDGIILAPGREFSYNETVGKRTRDRGFKKAMVIMGESGYDEGIGGGVCQVSSMLHAAAVYAGLEIIERSPHRFRVGYVDPGLDATVDWGRKDLRLRNPFPFPVQLQVGLVGKGELMVRITAPWQLSKAYYRYDLLETRPSDQVKLVKVDKVKNPVEFYGRPMIKIKRQLRRVSLLTGRRTRLRLEDNQYDASPWQLQVLSLPGEGANLRGVSQKKINKLLAGTGFTTASAEFKDLERNKEQWQKLPYVSRKRLARFTRFSDLGEVVAAGR